jgi:hypothetical protein
MVVWKVSTLDDVKENCCEKRAKENEKLIKS